MGIIDDGFVVYDHDPRTKRWARAAFEVALEITKDPDIRAQNLRHGQTWFVGVNALPNDKAGGVGGIPLAGPWEFDVPDLVQHAAQLSVVYPGYPQRDPDQTEANHRFRIDRMAAHVDGLLPEGPERRRFPREFHAYILGLPLNSVASAPTVVWKGSHRIMQTALIEAIGDSDPREVDVTDAYHAARRRVFETCELVRLQASVGSAFLIHRLALHGTARWDGPEDEAGRMIAFFRPELPDATEWLHSR